MKRMVSFGGLGLVAGMGLLVTGFASPAGAVQVLRPGYDLPRTCSEGRLLRWNGLSYECAAPVEGGGAAGVTRLEDLQGLPCGSGPDAGTLALAINPLSRVVSLACPRTGQFQLTAAVTGEGVVLSASPDFACGDGLGACSHAYDSGTLVTLTESHDDLRAAFTGWGGACTGALPTCQVAMDQAQLVTAAFDPILAVSVRTRASARNFSCQFSICMYTDVFTNSRARVTVTDLDTSAVLGVCDADTTAVFSVTQFAPLSTLTKTCRFQVPSGHAIRMQADDTSVLGGVLVFGQWATGPCAGSADPACIPADPFAAAAEALAIFN